MTHFVQSEISNSKSLALTGALPANPPKLRLISSLILLLAFCFPGKLLAQTTVTIGTGTTTSGFNSLLSTSTSTNKYSKAIAIYSAAELTTAGATPGLITKLAYQKTGGDYTTPDATLDIFIKGVSFTTHAASPVTWATEVAGATQVYGSTTHSFTAGDGWKEITLTTPFMWNGTDNLEIFVDWYRPGIPTASMNWHYTSVTNANAITYNGTGVTTSTRNALRPNIQITFAPAAGVDAGISAVTAPTSPVSPGVSVPVAAVVRNYGGTTVTSATLGFSVNGTVVANNVPFSGSLTTSQTSAPVTIGNFAFPAGTNTVKAWVKNPNGGGADMNLGNDTLSYTVVACNTVSGTYTINAKAAPSATNFQTFAAALNSLSGCGVSGPVTFNVAAGSGPYNEQVVIPAINGTSATNTITFQGAGDTISAAAGTHLGVVTFDGADYVTFDNFVITLDAGATSGWGVQLKNSANNNTISNCTISLPLDQTTSAVSGILAGSAVSTAGNNTSNSRFQNNTIIGGYYGIQLNGNTGGLNASNNEITGNTFLDNYIYNIYLDETDGTLIENNNISRPTRGTVSTFYGVYATGVNKNTVINRNRIHNAFGASPGSTNAAYVIYFSSTDAPAGSENIVKNNLIYNINTNGTIYVFYNIGSDGAHYFNNTVDLDLLSNTGTVRGFYQTTAATNLQVVNNIFTFNAGTIGAKHLLYYGTTSSGITSNNNVLYLTGGGSTSGIGSWGTANQAALSDWQSASSKDAASITADPEYMDPATGNFKPTNSTINNLGQPVAAVTTDFAGVTRNPVNPDPGAYEFTPLPFDAGLNALVSPVSPATPNASTPVQVTIKNYGSNTLTSATLGFSVNGTTIVNNYAFSGSLAPKGVSAPITIGNYAFPAGAYNLCVWTTAPNGQPDGNTLNDTTCTTIYSCVPLAGNYTVNAGAPLSATNFQSIAAIAQTLNSCGVSGPVTVTVAPNSGPYNEVVSLRTIAGVSATNAVVFEGNGNIITATPTSQLGLITMDGTDFTTINNFVLTVDNSATSGWGVQLMNGADNNTISGNTINLPLGTTSSNVNGIIAGATSTLAGNNTSNSKFQNNTIIGGYYGIRINGNTGSLDATNNQITGNTLRDNYTYNIYLSNTDGTLVENNTISRPTRTSVSTFYGVYMTNAKTTTVSKNRLFNTFGAASSLTGSSYGIYSTASDSPAGSESVFKNNLLYNFNNNGLIYGIYNAGSDGAHYYHNTIDLNNTANTGTVRGFYQTTAATNIRFVNNIVTINSGATGAKHALYFGTTTSAITSNNNVLMVTGGAATSGIGSWGTANQVAITDWRNASTQDANSVTVDPAYVDAANGNYKPTTVAVNNIGQPTPVTDDLTGTIRNAATPDPGAFEFDVVANDVAVVEIVNPNSVCGLSNTQTITVRIKNYGSATQTSVPVSFNVTGPVSSNGTGTYTGSLAPNATDTFTFTTTADLSQAGGYTITATTNLAGDVNPANDDTVKTVTNSLMAGVPITLDFESAATGLNALKVVTKSKGTVVESADASNGAGSTKGLLMGGVTNAAWQIPAGGNDPWVLNPEHLTGVYMCFPTSGLAASDSLWLTFNLKQFFKTANANTNFRVTVNGVQEGPTFRPPFAGGPAVWENVKIDLTAYKTQATIEIGLESSVAEEYANGTGTANMVDNIMVRTRIVNATKDDFLQQTLTVFPNPSQGAFNVTLPKGQTYILQVSDLTGKVVKTQPATSGENQLNLEGAAKGVYLLKVASKNGIAVKKLVLK